MLHEETGGVIHISLLFQGEFATGDYISLEIQYNNGGAPVQAADEVFKAEVVDGISRQYALESGKIVSLNNPMNVGATALDNNLRAIVSGNMNIPANVSC